MKGELTDEKMALYLRFLGWTWERRFKTGTFAWYAPDRRKLEPNTKIAYELSKTYVEKDPK